MMIESSSENLGVVGGLETNLCFPKVFPYKRFGLPDPSRFLHLGEQGAMGHPGIVILGREKGEAAKCQGDSGAVDLPDLPLCKGRAEAPLGAELDRVLAPRRVSLLAHSFLGPHTKGHVLRKLDRVSALVLIDVNDIF